MKKCIAILLALLLALSLAACAAKGDDQPQTPATTADDAQADSAATGTDAADSTDSAPSETDDSATEADGATNDSAPADGGDSTGAVPADDSATPAKVLVAYFSATNTTEGVAQTIADSLGADLYEITPEQPYTSEDLNYHDDGSRSTLEMNDPAARPAISGAVEDMDQYAVVFVGYPIWWASIPMPIASFLEEYDFAGKTIIPFCSHGGGRFGQSLTAIAKLVPDAAMGEALSIHYAGGSTLPDDIAEWLATNGLGG